MYKHKNKLKVLVSGVVPEIRKVISYNVRGYWMGLHNARSMENSLLTILLVNQELEDSVVMIQQQNYTIDNSFISEAMSAALKIVVFK